jgi:hypothetical protein
MFGSSKPRPTPLPPTPTPNPAALAKAQAAAQVEKQQLAEAMAVLQAEGAKVVVQNGTTQADLDAGTAQYLRNQGFNVVQFGPADRTDYPRTVIVDYTNKSYTLEFLANIFDVANENIRRSPNLKSEVDIRVIVGADFRLPEARLLESLPSDPFIRPAGGQ